MTKLVPHWQRTHCDDTLDANTFARWQPRAVTLITDSVAVKGIHCIPYNSLVVVRHHPMSENWEERGFSSVLHARGMGVSHALKCRELANWIRASDPRRDMNTVVFPGLNEPHVWKDEPPELTAEYYAAFLRALHSYDLHGVALNLGVGWPANAGYDMPPIWEPFEPVREAMRPGDYLGLHEYWGKDGPKRMLKWWAGRYTQCPWDVPIIIGECGIDQYVEGGHPAKRGWWAYVSAEEYVEQLAWYDDKLRQDPRIHSAHIFTYDFAHPWSTFNIRLWPFLNVFFTYIESLPPDPPEPPEPPTPPESPTDAAVREGAWGYLSVPWNPDAAFNRYAMVHSLGKPETPEFDLNGYRCQGFASCILVAKIGEWGDIWEVPWN